MVILDMLGEYCYRDLKNDAIKEIGEESLIEYFKNRQGINYE